MEQFTEWALPESKQQPLRSLHIWGWNTDPAHQARVSQRVSAKAKIEMESEEIQI